MAEQHVRANPAELAPGTRLIDSTPQERLMIAATWSTGLQDSRLSAVGLR